MTSPSHTLTNLCTNKSLTLAAAVVALVLLCTQLGNAAVFVRHEIDLQAHPSLGGSRGTVAYLLFIRENTHV